MLFALPRYPLHLKCKLPLPRGIVIIIVIRMIEITIIITKIIIRRLIVEYRNNSSNHDNNSHDNNDYLLTIMTIIIIFLGNGSLYFKCSGYRGSAKSIKVETFSFLYDILVI